MPAHILPGTRGCSPSGAVLECWCAPTFLAQVLVRLAGSRPPGRVSLGMESAGRAQPVRSGLALGGAIRLGWQSRQRLIGHRFGGVGRKKHAHMHTCIQKATQHVTKHRHAVTRSCPRALSSPVSARARPLCLLPSVLQSGRRRGSRRAAALREAV